MQSAQVQRVANVLGGLTVRISDSVGAGLRDSALIALHSHPHQKQATSTWGPRHTVRIVISLQGSTQDVQNRSLLLIAVEYKQILKINLIRIKNIIVGVAIHEYMFPSSCVQGRQHVPFRELQHFSWHRQ